jgi:hypothetical protein
LLQIISFSSNVGETSVLSAELSDALASEIIAGAPEDDFGNALC